MRFASRVLVLLILSLLGPVTGLSIGADDDAFPIAPRWRVGERVHYEMQRTRERNQDDGNMPQPEVLIDVELEVLEADEDGYVLAWTERIRKFEAPGPGGDVARRLAKLFDNYRLLLRVDRWSAIEGVENLDDVQQRTSKMIDLLREEMLNQGLAARDVDSILTAVRQAYTDEGQLVELITRAPSILFLPLGIDKLVPGKAVEYDDELPSPFGTEPLPTTGRFEITRVDARAQTATIAWSQTFDPEEATAAIRQGVERLAQRLGQSPGEAKLNDVFEIRDSAECEVDMKTGWPTSVEQMRFMRLGNITQRDGYRFTRRAVPPE